MKKINNTKLINFFASHKWMLLFCVLITLLNMYPNLITLSANIEHDTYFHLSRIEGYAQAMMNGDFIPRIYPFKNYDFGYGGPMFYSDYLLIIPSLLYILFGSITFSYLVLIFMITFGTAITMFVATKVITSNKYAPYLSSFLYLFSTYRLTGLYVRGSVGELMALMFVPLLIMALYYLYTKNYKSTRLWLIVSMSGIVFTHNITFVLACMFIIGFIVLNIRKLIFDKKAILCVMQAGLITVGIVAFFAFPMIEQMLDHPMMFQSYSGDIDMNYHTVLSYQLFANELVFGWSGNTAAREFIMNPVPGVVLSILPVLYLFFYSEKNPNYKFIIQCALFGYGAFILSTSIISWPYPTFLATIQFPWRFMIMAIGFLAIPAGLVLFERFKYKKVLLIIVLGICFLERSGELNKVMERTTVIKLDTTYEDIITGQIDDPLYSPVYYNNVELAAGDYLPAVGNSAHYINLEQAIYDVDLDEIQEEMEKEYNTIIFSLNNIEDEEYIVVPLTYFKGYQGYVTVNGSKTEVDTVMHESGLIMLDVSDLSEGDFSVSYKGTLVQTVSEIITLLTVIGLILFRYRDKVKKIIVKK